MKRNLSARSARAPTAAPTPIPALALVFRPEVGGVSEGEVVEIVVDEFVAVGAAVDVVGLAEVS